MFWGSLLLLLLLGPSLSRRRCNETWFSSFNLSAFVFFFFHLIRNSFQSLPLYFIFSPSYPNNPFPFAHLFQITVSDLQWSDERSDWQTLCWQYAEIFTSKLYHLITLILHATVVSITSTRLKHKEVRVFNFGPPNNVSKIFEFFFDKKYTVFVFLSRSFTSQFLFFVEYVFSFFFPFCFLSLCETASDEANFFVL